MSDDKIKSEPEPVSETTAVVDISKDNMTVQKMGLTVLSGNDMGFKVAINRDKFTIGKDLHCDLVLSDSTVSRKHVEVFRDDDVFSIRDLGSTNGTLINGTRIEQAYLVPGSHISLGTVELVFEPVPAPGVGEDSVPVEYGAVVSVNPMMKTIVAMLRKAADAGTSVLLRGEPGVGKMDLVRAMQEEGPLRDGPLEIFDCRAHSPQNVEAELLGYQSMLVGETENGSKGACERANGGMLFLDSVDMLPLDVQPKLLRALDDGGIHRFDTGLTIPIDLHVVASTSQDLNALSLEGVFRRDLYFRLAVIDVEVPPLRERMDDLPYICNSILEEAQGAHTWGRLAPTLREQLLNYKWPGNLGELRNILERFQLVGDDGIPVIEGLSDDPNGKLAIALNWNGPFKEAKENLVDTFEKEYLERLLERSNGRIAPAAREAGLNRKYFYDLLKKHGLYEKGE